MKVFKRSVWALGTLFFGIALIATVVGNGAAEQNAGWINSALGIKTYEQVDDSANSTPDVTYYDSPFIRTRWHLNAETGKYELEIKKNSELAKKNSIMWSREVDQEGTVLLKNENNSLPLASQAKVSLFGVGQYPDCYIATGKGSGGISPNFTDNLKDDLEANGIAVNPTLYSKYVDLGISGKYTPACAGNSSIGDVNYVEFKDKEAPYSTIQSAVDSSIADYGDSAIMIISRLGSENGDTDFKADECIDNNYMDLSNNEAEILTNLQALKKNGTIKHIVLVLNTCNAMQFKNINKYDIDSILAVGTGGTASFMALANILTGKADPSGHLADTYLTDSYSNPATMNFGDYSFTESNNLPGDTTYTHNTKYVVYQEGIYVGYKYYETRYEDIVMNRGNARGTFGTKASAGSWNYSEEVTYPFGYGSSYATFDRSNFKVSEKDGKISCSIDIMNTSSTYSGKDVFQVYLQNPYTDYDKANGIEQSSVNLVAVGKSPLLKPGKSAAVSVSFDKKELASYDSNKAKTYILEKGDYYISCGTSAHDALNNTLALKGYSTSDGMDEAGDAAKSKLYTVKDDDYETYSVSKTGYKITNQFDNADINRYEHTSDQKMTYLSRNDWEKTYPSKAVSLKCTDEGMVYDMQYGHGIEGYEDEKAVSPNYSQSNGLSLIDMLYKDFDDENWNSLLDEMTFDEQCKIVTYGANAFAGASSISAPGGTISDGPAGVRNYPNAVAYPNETVMACTFNTELIQNLGQAWGYELLDLGCNAIYGPGAGIHRSNFSGRNWEYYSEDGTLSGIMQNAELSGLSSEGVISYSKHCVLNDQERNRYGGTVWANEQSIRQEYLKAYELPVETGSCNGIMSSFNRIGCTWAGADKGLMSEVIRNEWGFKGTAITDAAVSQTQVSTEGFVKGVLAGQTMWLGGFGSNMFGSYSSQPVVKQAIRRAAKYNLYTQLHSNAMNGMKSGIKIIELTPWWKTTIKDVNIISGVCTGICGLMAVISFTLPLVTKRKELN